MAIVIFYGFSAFLLCAALGVVLCRNPVHGVLSLILAFFNGAGICLFLGAEFVSMVLVIVYVGAVAVLFLFAVMMIDMPSGGGDDPLSSMGWAHRMRIVGIFLRDSSIHLFLGLMFAVVVEWGFEQIGVVSNLWGFRLCIWLVSLIFARLCLRPFFKQSLWDQAKNALQSLPMPAIIGTVIGAELIFVIARWPGHHPWAVATERVVDQISNTHQIGRILYTDYIFSFQSVGIILLIAMVGAITLTLRVRERRRSQNPKDQMARRKKDSVELRHMPVGGGVS